MMGLIKILLPFNGCGIDKNFITYWKLKSRLSYGGFIVSDFNASH
jgi:hypothetical protein